MGLTSDETFLVCRMRFYIHFSLFWTWSPTYPRGYHVSSPILIDDFGDD